MGVLASRLACISSGAWAGYLLYTSPMWAGRDLMPTGVALAPAEPLRLLGIIPDDILGGFIAWLIGLFAWPAVGMLAGECAWRVGSWFVNRRQNSQPGAPRLATGGPDRVTSEEGD